jgi:hypothetical protein
LTACGVLACTGLVIYTALCWLFDISRARGRLKECVTFFRAKLANTNIG